MLQVISWHLLGSGGTLLKVDGTPGPRRLSVYHLRQDARGCHHLWAAGGRSVLTTALGPASLSRSDIPRSRIREEPRVPRLGTPQDPETLRLLG